MSDRFQSTCSSDRTKQLVEQNNQHFYNNTRNKQKVSKPLSTETSLGIKKGQNSERFVGAGQPRTSKDGSYQNA